jgi:iron complex outermembrane receptor protein
MDNLTVGYTFDLRGLSARVFGTVQNVFTITGYSGLDPTANIEPGANTSSLNGIDGNIHPRSRTYSAGLSLRL